LSHLVGVKLEKLVRHYNAYEAVMKNETYYFCRLPKFILEGSQSRFLPMVIDIELPGAEGRHTRIRDRHPAIAWGNC